MMNGTVVPIGLAAAAMVLPLCRPAEGTGSAPARLHGTYSTHFSRTENPISERGRWLNGAKDALDWANVQTRRGLAFGTQAGGSRSVPQKYDDSTALLAGAWGPDQTAEATVYSVNQSDQIYEEVELRLRSTLTAHRATGYEINFRCAKTAKAYAQIVRWDGGLGKFTYVKTGDGARYGVANKDVVKATIAGNVITVYINGVQVLQGTDDTFTSGSPGIGFYVEGATGVNGDFGFTSFTASDSEPARASADNRFHGFTVPAGNGAGPFHSASLSFQPPPSAW